MKKIILFLIILVVVTGVNAQTQVNSVKSFHRKLVTSDDGNFINLLEVEKITQIIPIPTPDSGFIKKHSLDSIFIKVYTFEKILAQYPVFGEKTDFWNKRAVDAYNSPGVFFSNDSSKVLEYHNYYFTKKMGFKYYKIMFDGKNFHLSKEIILGEKMIVWLRFIILFVLNILLVMSFMEVTREFFTKDPSSAGKILLWLICSVASLFCFIIIYSDSRLTISNHYDILQSLLINGIIFAINAIMISDFKKKIRF